ncbi:MAG: hypothetical protein HRU34_07860 [Richelia sp.]|nr:hypothetical protein [Richelia sp.]
MVCTELAYRPEKSRSILRKSPGRFISYCDEPVGKNIQQPPLAAALNVKE